MAVQKSKSVFWYLLPISIGIIGGIIAFFILRKSDSHKAKNCLGIGIGITVGVIVANSAVTSTIFPPNPISDFFNEHSFAYVYGELMVPVILSSFFTLWLYSYLIIKIKIKIIVYGISIVLFIGFFVLISIFPTLSR